MVLLLLPIYAGPNILIRSLQKELYVRNLIKKNNIAFSSLSQVKRIIYCLLLEVSVAIDVKKEIYIYSPFSFICFDSLLCESLV